MFNALKCCNQTAASMGVLILLGFSGEIEFS